MNKEYLTKLVNVFITNLNYDKTDKKTKFVLSNKLSKELSIVGRIFIINKPCFLVWSEDKNFPGWEAHVGDHYINVAKKNGADIYIKCDGSDIVNGRFLWLLRNNFELIIDENLKCRKKINGSV